jgi:hypothetical protein
MEIAFSFFKNHRNFKKIIAPTGNNPNDSTK